MALVVSLVECGRVRGAICPPFSLFSVLNRGDCDVEFRDVFIEEFADKHVRFFVAFALQCSFVGVERFDGDFLVELDFNHCRLHSAQDCAKRRVA